MAMSEKLICPVTGIECSFAVYCEDQNQSSHTVGIAASLEASGELPEEIARAVSSSWCSSEQFSDVSKVQISTKNPRVSIIAALVGMDLVSLRKQNR